MSIDLIHNPDSTQQTQADTIRVVPDFEWIHDKEPGIFSYPDCPVFTLHRNIENYDILVSHISIPGYKTIDKRFVLLSNPVFYSPNQEGLSITYRPDKAFLVKYSQGFPAEVRLSIEIIEKSTAGFSSDTISLIEYGSSQVKFTFGQLQSALNLQLDSHAEVEYRKFGNINILIWMQNTTFPEGIKTPYIDYTVPGSPWIPEVIFYGGTYASSQLLNLQLDDRSREVLAYDTSLAKFKFVKW